MSALLVGYARCSTDQQDLTVQRDGLVGLGVATERIYVDHGLTGTNRERPGLREALAACRSGDTLVVTKLDRLARSLPDARAIADELTARQVRLNLGGSVNDPTDAVQARSVPSCSPVRSDFYVRSISWTGFSLAFRRETMVLTRVPNSQANGCRQNHYPHVSCRGRRPGESGDSSRRFRHPVCECDSLLVWCGGECEHRTGKAAHY